MRKEDWEKLCRNIYEKKCILFLGSEFPLEFPDGQNTTRTSFSKLLSAKIADELNNYPWASRRIRNIQERELSQLAGDYINYTDVNRSLSRESLENILINYFDDVRQQIQSPSFVELCSLPFYFIVDTNYDTFFSDQLYKHNKSPQTAYYNFKGNKIDLVETLTDDTIGTERHPFVYNLFGRTSYPSSLVVSENDLIQFVINIISKNPGLPANIKSELANTEKCFLFIGFGFLAKNWYFRILLQALESSNKGRMSYALECIDNISNDEDPTILFFRDELKVSLYHYDQQKFIETLVESYKSYADKRKSDTVQDASLYDVPKVFISYKSEDYDTALNIYTKLKKLGLNPWLDKKRLSGMWEENIAKEINQSDSFLLVQSRSLKENPVNYVNIEIKTAIAKAKYYQPESDFLFPTFIDSGDSILKDKYQFLNEINSYDLTVTEKLDQLAKDIKRSYERNKRKRAA